MRSTRIFAAPFALNVCATLLWGCAVFGGGWLADVTPPKRLGKRRGRQIFCSSLALWSAAAALLLAILAPILFLSLSADCTAQHTWQLNISEAVALAADANDTSTALSISSGIESADVSSTSSSTTTAAATFTTSNSNSTPFSANKEADVATACIGASPPIVFIPLLALGVIAHGVHVGPLQAWFVLSLREAGSRYSALGVAYNLGAAALGGTTPLIATSISASAWGIVAAGCYLSLAAVVSALTICASELFAPISGVTPALLPAVTPAATASEPAEQAVEGAASGAELATTVIRA